MRRGEGDKGKPDQIAIEIGIEDCSGKRGSSGMWDKKGVMEVEERKRE